MPAYNYFGVFRCAEASAQFLLQKLEYKTLNLLNSVVQNYFRNLNRLLFTQAAGGKAYLFYCDDFDYSLRRPQARRLRSQRHSRPQPYRSKKFHVRKNNTGRRKRIFTSP